MLKIFLGYICWKQFQDFSAGKHCSVHVDTRPARQLFRAVVVLGTGKSEGARRVFGRICPNFPEKLLCHLPTNFLPQRPSRPFFVWHARCVFLQTLGAIFFKSNNVRCHWSVKVVGDPRDVEAAVGVDVKELRAVETGNKNRCCRPQR